MNSNDALAQNSTSQAMSQKPERAWRSKFLENSVLVIVGLFAHAPLYYQLPRWANGLDPTFVHHAWIERSSFPLLLHMANVSPIVWISLIVLVLIRICWNYGWRLEK